MRNLVIALLLAYAVGGFAQNLEINELTTPSTPAFTILELSPTDISRPTHTKPFLMSLANGLNGKSIASDISIETTPYWWAPRPGLTYQEYYGLDTSEVSFNKFIERIARSAAFSIATSDASPNVDSVNSRNLAAGIRFQVLPGQPSRIFKEAYGTSLLNKTTLRTVFFDLKFKVDRGRIQSMDSLLAQVEKSVQTTIATNSAYDHLSTDQIDAVQKSVEGLIKTQIRTVLGAAFEKEQVMAFLEEQRAHISDKVNEQIVEMDNMSRVGWLWEFAGAVSFLAPTNQIDYVLGREWAAWTTLTYRFDAEEGSSHVNDFNLMARVSGGFYDTVSYNTDMGLSWAMIGDNHSLTLEGIFRNFKSYKEILATDGQMYRVQENHNTWRFALAYQFKFSDFFNVSLTAGKDYSNSKITAGGFFSLLNFNFALPSKETILVK